LSRTLPDIERAEEVAEAAISKVLEEVAVPLGIGIGVGVGGSLKQ
jgi:hypothetical protein